MTIYLQIVQHFFPQALDIIHETSIKWDSFATTFPIFARNTELSAAKLRAVSELRSNIEKLPQTIADNNLTQPITDEKINDTLANLIDTCLKDMRTKRETLGGPGFREGLTEPALIKLKQLIRDIFEKSIELEVLNIPYDTNPLNCFRYYITLFNAQILFDVAYETGWTRILNNLNIDDTREITAKQIALMKDTITDCKTKIDRIKHKIENYNDVIAQDIIDFITKLQRKNIAICSSYNTSVKMTMSFFKAPKFNMALLFNSPNISEDIPTGGYVLGELLVQAVKEIQNNLAKKASNNDAEDYCEVTPENSAQI